MVLPKQGHQHVFNSLPPCLGLQLVTRGTPFCLRKHKKKVDYRQLQRKTCRADFQSTLHALHIKQRESWCADRSRGSKRLPGSEFNHCMVLLGFC